MNAMKENRRGIVVVAAELFEESLPVLRTAFAWWTVNKVDDDPVYGRVVLLEGYSPHFEPLPLGQAAPCYKMWVRSEQDEFGISSVFDRFERDL